MDAVSTCPVLRQSRASRSQHWPPSSLRPLSEASCLRRARIGSCDGEGIYLGPARSQQGRADALVGTELQEPPNQIVIVRRRSPFYRKRPPSHLGCEGDLRAGEALLPVELLHRHPQPVRPRRPAAVAAVDESGYRTHGVFNFLLILTPTEVSS